MAESHPRTAHEARCSRRARAPGALCLLALGLALALGLVACENGKLPPPPPPDDGLKLEKAYTNQELEAWGTAEYKFHAEKRGAYLIMVYGNPTPLEITLKHPKKTCFLLGNGSCELVTGPDEAYRFEVTSDSGEPVVFSLKVSHSEGTGRYEGEVGRPVSVPANAQHEGTVGIRESSYYSFTTGPGGNHTIALTGTQSDLVWRLFDAAEYDVILEECDFHAGASDEVCRTRPLWPDTRYYVKVQEQSGVPGPYRLQIFTPQ